MNENLNTDETKVYIHIFRFVRFDNKSICWTEDREHNLYFLKTTEMYLKELAKTQGFLMLNDVYYALGLPRTLAGYRYGWFKDDISTFNLGIKAKTPSPNFNLSLPPCRDIGAYAFGWNDYYEDFVEPRFCK